MKCESEEPGLLKLSELFNKGLMDLKEQIRDISEIASKELSFERVYI